VDAIFTLPINHFCGVELSLKSTPNIDFNDVMKEVVVTR